MIYRNLLEGVVREYPPCRRTIRFFGRSEKDYFLQFPITLFANRMWTDYYALRVGFVKQPITSWNDLVYIPPLGNIYNLGTVCNTSRSSDINHAINAFWSSEFGMDGSPGRHSNYWTFSREENSVEDNYRELMEKGFEDWAAISRAKIVSPLTLLWFTLDRMLDCPWKSSKPVTLRAFLGDINLDFSAEYLEHSNVRIPV